MIIASVIIVAGLVASSASAIAEPVPQIAVRAVEVTPEVTAKGAIAVDLTTGRELYAHDPDLPLPPASTVKIVTALVALQLLSLDERITIEQRDLVGEEYSAMGLLPGDEATVQDLLYGLLVASGGDAGLALARVAGMRLDPATDDPIATFVTAMNGYGQALGMSGSHFADPIGSDIDGSVVTARDLVRASSALLENRLLRQIVATPWLAVAVAGPNARDLVLENSNQYVLYGEGSIGIKTGTTDLAGECLVNAVLRGDNIIVTVVLGSEYRYDDTNAILGALDGAISWFELGVGAESAGATEALAADGLWIPVRRTIVLPAEAADRIVWNLLLEPSGGAKRGAVSFSIDGEEIARLPVYAIDAWEQR